MVAVSGEGSVTAGLGSLNGCASTSEKILPAYKTALFNGGIHILVEYPELYYKN